MTGEPAPTPHDLVQRVRARRETHRRRSRLYRTLFALCGIVVTGAGIVMLVLPGPALAVIPIGLFMLALEFTWAERLLVRCLEQAERARRRAETTSRLQRVLAGVATTLAVCAAAAVALLWDVPVLPV